jgi:hypothetical protein
VCALFLVFVSVSAALKLPALRGLRIDAKKKGRRNGDGDDDGGNGRGL